MTISQTLPPRFDGVVFAYPLVKFRPDRIQLPQLDGVVVMIDGRQEPCDGSMWAIDVPPVCVGAFVAVHVINLTAEPRELVLRLIGQVQAEPGASARTRGDVARSQGLTWALGGGR